MPNLATDEMEEIIRRGDSVILDARPPLEWAISHIPTAVNVAPKPGTSISLYVSDVAEIERIAGGDKHKPLVLYCNGPFCGKSQRLAGELVAAGYTNVRRYQLGAPVWRALGKVMVIEPEGVRYVLTGDRTAVFIDAREHAEFSVVARRCAQHPGIAGAAGKRCRRDQGRQRRRPPSNERSQHTGHRIRQQWRSSAPCRRSHRTRSIPQRRVFRRAVPGAHQSHPQLAAR